MRHRCYHGAAHQSTASHSWFTQLHKEVNYLTSKLRHLKSKPCGNYKYAEGRNCKTEQQNKTELLPTFWHWQFELLATFQRQTKTFWNSKWIRLSIHEFPTRFSHFHIEEKQAATKKTLESMQYFMNLNRRLIDSRAICMMSKLMSYVDALWVSSTYTYVHTHTHITVHAYSLRRQFVSITQVSAHSSKSFHGFLFAGALRVNEESACCGRV